MSTDNLESTIITNLVHNDSFTRKVIPHIKPEYFTGKNRIVYELILGFLIKYNKLPNSAVLDIEFRNSEHINRADRNDILGIIQNLDVNIDVEAEWLIDSTEKWCKDRAVNIAIMEAVSIIDGTDKTQAEGAIPSILSKALSITFDTNIGHDYIEDGASRYEFYHRKEDKLSFDIEMLNTITNGGVTRKTLNLIIAGTGCGKSLGLCHFAAAAMSEGRNVLYITMEMAEERIAERIDANLFDVDIKQIGNLSKESFTKKVAGIKAKTLGKLIIKEYPTGSAHVGHFRALLMELKMKKNFVPDIIFIDYLNICASSRIKGGISGSINSYGLNKSIAEEIRGLGVEFNVPMWTATQVNRTGFSSSDTEITDTSESFGVPATADLMVAFIRTEQLDKMNQIMIKQLKNRYNDTSENKRFTVGVDFSKMRLYDIADPTANIMADSPSTPAVKPTPFMAGKTSATKFTDFKM